MSKHTQLINIAKAELNMSEDAYRALLVRVTQKNSLRDMTYRQHVQVLNEMMRLGFVIQVKKEPSSTQVPRQHELIKSLWQQLFDRGAVKNSSDAALNHFIDRSVNVSVLQWLDSKQSSQIIERLKKWLERTRGKS